MSLASAKAELIHRVESMLFAFAIATSWRTLEDTTDFENFARQIAGQS
jgi:hypothetical protein